MRMPDRNLDMSVADDYSNVMGMTLTAEERLVEIPADSVVLPGGLTIPTVITSLVIFAHGKGPSRYPRGHAPLRGAGDPGGSGPSRLQLVRSAPL